MRKERVSDSEGEGEEILSGRHGSGFKEGGRLWEEIQDHPRLIVTQCEEREDPAQTGPGDEEEEEDEKSVKGRKPWPRRKNE